MPPKSSRTPRWEQYPDLYARNVRSGRFLLKSASTYQRDVKLHPEDYIEARSIYADPAKGPLLPMPPLPPPPDTRVWIGTPTPPPTLSSEELAKEAEKKENERMRDRMRSLLQAELRTNPAPYRDRDAAEVSALFKKMLIERLTREDAAANPACGQPTATGGKAVRARAAPPPAPARWRLAPAREEVESDDEYDEDELEDG
jgi:hypothetical protein